MAPTAYSPIDSPAFRSAGPEALSLALMDARNHTLHLLGLCEAHGLRMDGRRGDPLWLAGRAGWFAEAWIGRNTQRQRGPACPPRPTRLASIEPRADAWWGEDAQERQGPGPDAQATRSYLLEQLESTLELLERAPADDAALYFFRLAVLHEDLRGEDMLVQMQRLEVPVPLQPPEPRRPLEPVVVPALRWRLGAEPGGLVLDNEQWAHEIDIPEFEIDAQPVSWAQFVEFVDDGGYDRQELWSSGGWDWLERCQAEDDGRRGPRYVEQIGVASGAVLQRRFGHAVRVAAQHSAMHLSWWEADAWCRWAGRRLPTEAEWDCAAHTAARRGFEWGSVHEWLAGTLRPWPGFTPGPWAGLSEPWMGRARAQRGASFATRARLRDARLRGFGMADDDWRFVGFRSCAL